MKKKIEKSSSCFKIVLTIILAARAKITLWVWEASNIQYQQRIIQEPYDLMKIIGRCEKRMISEIFWRKNSVKK
jgi:hypothetical protein